MKNFTKVDDFTRDEIYSIIRRGKTLRDHWRENTMPQTLRNKKIALWFYGQGFRNRVAFEIGARAMGADVSFIPGELGVHEPIEDITHYLNNWFSMIVIRCKNHHDLEQVVSDADIPIINASTAYNHPCEIVGDLQFIHNERNTIDGLRVVFVGEKTNLCMSWFEAARVLPIHVLQVGPQEYLTSPDTVMEVNKNAVGTISTSAELDNAITRETDVIYTDCWPRTEDKESRARLFRPYQVTKAIVAKMNPKGYFLPCPPITRGEEVSDDSLSALQYCDYQAKAHLLHAQNAIMEYCLEEKSA